ncbi:hypothetical protein PHJA_002636400 [Phtheirospermum japonicum]|uniref:Phospholipase-like protein (PEARLI 4) family protein n=1 Tax=Phtheirospermum japonicum TaxID=374723 RepID=A0A830D2Q9_9LAMI|nr:hypothetical protein PHJA_002636400 [Phtheirospermum japonicum]
MAGKGKGCPRKRGGGQPKKAKLAEEISCEPSKISVETVNDQDFVSPLPPLSRYTRRNSINAPALFPSPLPNPTHSLKKTRSSTLKPENVVNHDNPKGPTKSECSSYHSFNVTEFAKRLHDDINEDPDEVNEAESALGPGFTQVHGHRVKSEIAPLLEGIFVKHGDITAECTLESPELRSHFLGRLCSVYDKLQQAKFPEKITHVELDEMLLVVRDCEKVKINVGWLRARIEYVSDTLTGYYKYLRFKERGAEYEKYVESKEKELGVYEGELAELERKVCLVRQRVCTAREEVVAKRAKAEEMKKMVEEIKTRVKTLRGQTVVHGLV